MDVSKAVMLTDHVFWIGKYLENDPFQCHPYLIDNGDESILIDPGSVLEFDAVIEKTKSVTALKNIKYIILHHQDPDLCASVPMIEKLIDRDDLQIVTHSRMTALIKHYRITSTYYEIDKHDFKLTTSSGLALEFVTTPYCHSPGAFVTYDSRSKVLFSSDIFGALSESWQFFADENYFEKLKAFHAEYMPSKDILNYCLNKIEKLDISFIAPQHGSIIKKEYIRPLIDKMKNLECGLYIDETYNEELTDIIRTLKLKENFLHTVIESNNSAIIAIDKEQVIQIFNKSAQEMFGYSEEEMVGKDALEKIIPQRYWQRHRSAASNFIETKLSCGVVGGYQNLSALKKNGDEFPVRIGFGVTLLDDEMVIVANISDTTVEERQKRKLEEQKTFLQTVIDGIDDSVMVINSDYTIELMNDAGRKLIGSKRVSDSEHPKCYELSHLRDSPCDGIEHLCPLRKVMLTGEPERVVHKHYDTDGSDRFVELIASPLKDKEGNVYAIIESAHDITMHLSLQEKLQQQNEELAHRATHNTLTGLPNRLLFFDRLEQSIKKAHRDHTMTAVLIFDIDHFKEINDSLGHAVGDRLLIEISSRLKENADEADTIAHLGGDEFATIIESVDQLQSIIEVTDKLLALFQKALYIDEHELYVTCSIGISVYPNDSENPETLLRNADAAMYRAKEEGRNSYQFYTADMTERAFERVLMETYLRRALEHNELIVYYQPQFDAVEGKLTGMEALVRWQNPEVGLVPPIKFIPLAEETGFIVAIDRWVMQVAMNQITAWYGQGLEPGRVALNLSIKHLQTEDFIEKLKRALDETGCSVDHVEMEITEGQVMTHPEQAIEILQQISDFGIELAIDDFGTGHSSLAYLKRLPVDKLKIDRSFIRGLPEDEEDVAISKAVIAMARSMKLKVIAEGVETTEQKEFLIENGCVNIQGYLLGKPMPAEEMEALLRSLRDGNRRKG